MSYIITWLLKIKKTKLKLKLNFFYTFPMSLCFNDLTNPSWPHCILGSECELVPGATLEVLQSIGTLTGTDGEVPPLLTVIF